MLGATEWKQVAGREIGVEKGGRNAGVKSLLGVGGTALGVGGTILGTRRRCCWVPALLAVLFG